MVAPIRRLGQNRWQCRSRGRRARARPSTAGSSPSSRDRRSRSPCPRATCCPGTRTACSSATPGSSRELRLRVNDEWPEPLAAHTLDPFSAAFVLRATPAGRARPTRTSWSSATASSAGGCARTSSVHNYGEEPAFCAIELALRLRLRRPLRGQGEPGREGRRPRRRVRQARRATFTLLAGQLPARRPRRLLGAADRRRTVSRPSTRSSSAPTASWSLCVQVTPIIDEQRGRARGTCAARRSSTRPRTRGSRRGGRTCPASRPTTTRSSTCSHARPRTSPRCGSSTPSSPTGPSSPPARPWFMTLFGRDSLITSWMAMLVDSDLALGHAADAGPAPGPRRRPDHRGGAGAHPPRDALRRERPALARRRAASTTAASTRRRCS